MSEIMDRLDTPQHTAVQAPAHRQHAPCEIASEPQRKRDGSVLIVIPTLNEADHIDDVIGRLLNSVSGRRLGVVVADGGSQDGTQQLVQKRCEQDARVTLIHNPHRRQAAGINLAIATLGTEWDYLVRADAHAGYPPDFCETLLADAAETGAAAVTVPMKTVGTAGFAAGVAAAQNSVLGTGGSNHRMCKGGQFVDHGHHALMRIDAFQDVGGYDATFAHNEDAELDHRLTAAGHQIWLSGRTEIDYFPRKTISSLAKQYFNYGKGRAKMLAKHRKTPRLRQLIPVFVALSIGLAGLGLLGGAMGASVSLWLTLPAMIWAFCCLGYGAGLAIRERRADIAWAGPAAMVMHAAWGLGFLRGKMRGS